MNNHKKEYKLIKFEDGEFSLDVNVSPNEDTVWLTKQQIAELYERDRSVISKHIKAIFLENECDINSNVQKMHIPNSDKPVDMYNLDVILSIGYRVKSKRGNMFRKWATTILKQYLLNGYSINYQRCIDCQDNIIHLNNEIQKLNKSTDNLENRLINIESIEMTQYDKLFYEEKVFEAYSYIKQLFQSAKKDITIIDSYIDLSVLDMLNGIDVPINIYTSHSAHITIQDILKFQTNNDLKVYRTTKIHDRFIIIDETIYSIGSSIKDVGKKRFIMIKLDSIKKETLLADL